MVGKVLPIWEASADGIHLPSRGMMYFSSGSLLAGRAWPIQTTGTLNAVSRASPTRGDSFNSTKGTVQSLSGTFSTGWIVGIATTGTLRSACLSFPAGWIGGTVVGG